MKNLTSTIIIILTATFSSICSLFANDMPLDEILLEYLLSYAAETKYNELVEIRAYKYDGAENLLQIEDVIEKNVSLDIDEYSKKLIPYSINVEDGKRGIKNKLSMSNPLDINELSYVHWLIEHNNTKKLKELMGLIDNPNQIWQPAFIENEDGDYPIPYYLNTQFMLSRSYAEYYMQSNIDNIDLGWDSEKIYLWFSLLPSMNEGYKLEALDNDITYHEKFVFNSISLQLGMKSGLTDYEYDLFNNSTLDQLDRLISAFDEMLDDDEMDDIWSDCECSEEYGLFAMKIMLVNILIQNKHKPLLAYQDIISLEKSFEDFQNILNIITYKYDEIDHDLFCLYFANNFNNIEKQQPFIIEYLDDIGMKKDIKFALILSTTLKEIMAYTFSPVGGKKIENK